MKSVVIHKVTLQSDAFLLAISDLPGALIMKSLRLATAPRRRYLAGDHAADTSPPEKGRH